MEPRRAEWAGGAVSAAATVASFSEMSQKTFGDRAAEFLKAYPATTDAEAVRSTIDFAGDSFIAFGTWEWLEAQVSTGRASVYRYHFERPAPADNISGGLGGVPFRRNRLRVWHAQLPHGCGLATGGSEAERSGGELLDQLRAHREPERHRSARVAQYNAADGWQLMHLDVNSEPGADQHRDRVFFYRAFG